MYRIDRSTLSTKQGKPVFLKKYEDDQDLLKVQVKQKATKTILSQIFCGVASLLGGIAILVLVQKLNNLVDINWEGSRLSSILFGGFGLCFLTVAIPWVQFQQAYTGDETFGLSLQYAIFGMIFSFLLELFLFVLVGIPIVAVIINLSVTFLLFLAFAVLIGLLNAIRTQITEEDSQEHHWFLTNEADLLACQHHLLPYRHKVLGFWRASMFLVLSLIFILFITPIFLQQPRGVSEAQFGLAFLFIVGFIVVGVYQLFKEIDFLYSTNFETVEGKFEKVSSGRGHHFLKLDASTFVADVQTWKRVNKHQSVTLIYSPRSTNSGRVIAIAEK